MPICTQCQNKWNYKDTLTRLTRSGEHWNCPFCKKIQYPTFASLIRFTVLYFLAAGSLLVFPFVDVSIIQAVVIFTACGVSAFLMLPFTLRLSKTKESSL